MPAGKLYSFPHTENFLEDCKSLQDEISQVGALAAKDEIGRQACKILQGRTSYEGNRRVIAKSDAALVLPKQADTEECTRVLQFHTVTAKGYMGNVTYMRAHEEGFLALPIYDAQVFERSEVDIEDIDPEALEFGHYMPTTRPSKLPFHMPVKLIEYILPAA